MRRGTALCMALLLVLPVLALAQDRVAVFEFETIGVDKENAEAATRIFCNELNATGKFAVLPKAEVEAKLGDEGITDFTCYAIACAAEYGFIAGADKAVFGCLTMLGGKITVDVSLVSVVRKEVEFSDRFTATSLDDLDSALRKLAYALAERKKIVSEATRFAITKEETVDARRKKSLTTAGGAFGPSFPLGDSYAKLGILYNISFLVVRYEANEFVVESSFGVSWGSGGEKDTLYDFYDDQRTISDKRKLVIFPWDVGLRYVFNRGAEFTPFVGGGIGLHFIVSQDVGGITYSQSDQAFALHAAAGMYMFQSYDFRFTLEGRYTALFTEAFSESGSVSHQIGFMISVTHKLDSNWSSGCFGGGCMY